jgi:hypothetical protein
VILGSSIEPEKPSAKSASTANPPPKSQFYTKFIEIYHYSWLRQFIATHYRIVGFIFWSLVLFCSLPFFGIQTECLLWVFLVIFSVTDGLFYGQYSELCNATDQQKHADAPKKGHLQAQTQEQAIIRDPISPLYHYFLATQFIRSRHRP